MKGSRLSDNAWRCVIAFWNRRASKVTSKQLYWMLRSHRAKTVSNYCYLLYAAGYLKRAAPGVFELNKRIPAYLTRDKAYEQAHRALIESGVCPHCGGEI